MTAAEILVQTSPREGLAVLSDKGLTVAIDAVITPELRAEGLAREVVRRVQDLRKKAGLNIEDRIRVRYQATPGLQGALVSFRDFVMNETLAVEWTAGDALEGMASNSDEFDGEKLTVFLSRA